MITEYNPNISSTFINCPPNRIIAEFLSSGSWKEIGIMGSEAEGIFRFASQCHSSIF